MFDGIRGLAEPLSRLVPTGPGRPQSAKPWIFAYIHAPRPRRRVDIQRYPRCPLIGLLIGTNLAELIGRLTYFDFGLAAFIYKDRDKYGDGYRSLLS
jgi:hypothetical protein